MESIEILECYVIKYLTGFSVIIRRPAGLNECDIRIAYCTYSHILLSPCLAKQIFILVLFFSCMKMY